MNIVLKICLILIVSTLFLAGCSDQPQSSTNDKWTANGKFIGQTAADFTLKDMQGKQVSLSQFRGQVVILNFWATWCPPCREEMPSMESLSRHFAEKGLVMLAVNTDQDGDQAVSRFLSKTPFTFPILLDIDAEVQNLYQVYRLPESYLIDRSGKVVEKIIGGRDWMSSSMVKKISLLLGS